MQANEQKLFYKVYFRFLILRVRAKISFMAFEKRMTIVELFTSTILKCYKTYTLHEIAGYVVSEDRQKQEKTLYQQLVSGNLQNFLQ